MRRLCLKIPSLQVQPLNGVTKRFEVVKTQDTLIVVMLKGEGGGLQNAPTPKRGAIQVLAYLQGGWGLQKFSITGLSFCGALSPNDWSLIFHQTAILDEGHISTYTPYII